MVNSLGCSSASNSQEQQKQAYLYKLITNIIRKIAPQKQNTRKKGTYKLSLVSNLRKLILSSLVSVHTSFLKDEEKTEINENISIKIFFVIRFIFCIYIKK